MVNLFRINSKASAWLLVCIFSFFSCSSVYAQNKNNIEKTVRKVANQIIRNTSFRFKNFKTDELYKSTNGLPVTLNIKAASKTNRWIYGNGVVYIAMVRLGKILHDDKYTQFALHNFNFIFSNLDYFKKVYEKLGPKAERGRTQYRGFFRMDRLDDCGALGAALIDVNKIAHKQSYRNYINRVAKYISTGQYRLSDGTLARDHPREMTVWGDDLYMSVPFLVRMGNLTDNTKYYEDAVKQVENFNRHLYDPATGLFFHNWYSDVKMNGVAHWGRANGWIMMAQVALLEHLPKDYPKRQELIHLLLRQIVGASRYQDESGLWHQILNKPDSYLETSVTAMFVYSIAKAVNEGWIPHTYLSVAKKGWKGLKTKINKYGDVEDVCAGTAIQDNIQFYYNRPTNLNGLQGLGAVLLAGNALIKAAR
jgi:rhamnogalacturonyl hydrolase YesR